MPKPASRRQDVQRTFASHLVATCTRTERRRPLDGKGCQLAAGRKLCVTFALQGSRVSKCYGGSQVTVSKQRCVLTAAELASAGQAKPGFAEAGLRNPFAQSKRLTHVCLHLYWIGIF